MAFQPSAYKSAQPKPLPVILLLDGSGSMSVSGKIEALNEAVQVMIRQFAEEAQKDREIWVSIILFNGDGARVHTPYTPVQELQTKGFATLQADGYTPLGGALTLAKEMIEDKGKTPSRAYRPAVILVSDGEPNDEWEEPMQAFMEGRSAKCQRFAMPIGPDANRSRAIRQFLGDDCIENLFYADKAADIAHAFNCITMSVSQRVRSRDLNVVAVSRAAAQSAPAAETPADPEPKPTRRPSGHGARMF